jgi:hypothetical protein
LPASVAVDSQYEPSSPCLVCGVPTMSLAIRCQACLEKSFLKEELQFAKEWLRLHPDVDIELAHDKGQLVHLVCLRTPALAWCGARVTQVRAKRRRVKRGGVPEDICKSCFGSYVEIFYL